MITTCLMSRHGTNLLSGYAHERSGAAWAFQDTAGNTIA
ncbi:hypothetical protein ACVWZV_007161 [Bradyrhizobium sp. GM5.1]